MHRLFRLLHRWKCKNAAQKLALDALTALSSDTSESWPPLFLWNIEPYLRGVDAPEKEFQDFANHVFYPSDNWGGAVRLARKWYWRTVESLRCSEWSDAAYHAGVLCRYSSFTFLPLRTANDEVGLSLCAPTEWSLSKLYDELVLKQSDAPTPELPAGEQWLEELLSASSLEAHQHLKVIKNRFDLAAVVKDPQSLDEELRAVFSRLLLQARRTLGVILDRAIHESGANPPRYPLGLATTFAIPALPLFWLTRSQSAAADWKAISSMSREHAQSGEIRATLTASAVSLRDTYAIDVLKQSPATASLHLPEVTRIRESSPDTDRELRIGQSSKTNVKPSQPKRRRWDGPINDAAPPTAASSMSVEMGENFATLGIRTIRDLLAAGAEEIAASLGSVATAMDVVAWQDEARLCCELRGLEPVEAQLLVACGVTGADDLAALEPVELWELVSPVAESPDGRRLLHGDPPPDIDTVTRWIEAAIRLRRAA